MSTEKNKNLSIKILAILLSAIVLFHICVMAKIIPYNIAWGGRIENDSQMYIFESISIFLNVFLIVVLFLKNKVIKMQVSEKLINIILWFFLILFLLNTIGNIFAKTQFEKFFAILTFAFSVLLWLVLRKDNKNKYF